LYNKKNKGDKGSDLDLSLQLSVEEEEEIGKRYI
jgi:hypothetical protein